MKTKTEIIQETYDYYTADPNGRRATNLRGECVYLTHDGRRCALGRCLDRNLPDNVVMEIKSGIGAVGLLKGIAEDMAYPQYQLPIELGLPSMNFLSEEYRVEDVEFWKKLQSLHDNSGNWDKKSNKITEQGQEYYNTLMKQYADTVPEQQ